jgi:type IV pilus assembly protein PilC
MAMFEYIAKDVNGVIFSGIYKDVANAALLREELAKMGDSLIKAKRRKPAASKQQKIRPSEVVTFAYNFSGMCAAGLSIIKSLESLEQQAENRFLRFVLSDIKGSVERGATLKDAFDKYRYIFSDFFVGMIEAGESAGNLGKTLELSAKYLEDQANIRQKVKTAFAYPIVVGAMCLLIVTILLIFIIPVFSKLYNQMHITLPGATQILIAASLIIRKSWPIVILGITGSVFLTRYLLKKTSVKKRIDIWKLKMPIFGNLNKMVAVSQFMRTFSMLTNAGVSLTGALSVAGDVVNNAKISEISRELQQSIEAGNTVTASLKSHDIFPPTIIQLADSGEEVGSLPEMLAKGVDFLDKDIERKISSLLLKLEPLMTLIMGAIIGIILMAVYLPMFDYMSQVK